MLLKDKLAVVTGGARGIGREIALLFAKEGADVALFDINQEQLDKSVKDIEALGRTSLGLVVDVAKSDQVEAAINKTLDKFKKIDILINNAGITRDALLIRMSEADFDAVININLKGAFNCSKSVTKIMMKQRSGRIVNIASIIGLMGNAGQVNYAASKAGMIGMTKSLAKELASRNINVNAIAPGFIETDMTAKLPQDVREQLLKLIPAGRLAQPAEVAKAALFLSGSLSDYITGQVIQVDGGMLM
ncbi:MAG: 3-oxoacyl-ACP reductase [Candidatus Omnitrophica bacterium CG12_big_fil_rev_8_21_14_0_65_43_15]|uniref:3-oxoacyl-[acyl-carrier-protein] reductase n=1 Tax=Candidatus Taenaricola geysiri TaxID=1974752 RepID=A0A2J0LG92_9BACT|nr:MAG: 3-oxoacyl-[acyl-carrier-protein] reductase [Candidatus Omnitrophica bacterium CG1_02_43_210]PIR65595.1 MAG: 3-oxoacyl-ACP reductase [Candidatus Omnitrophica bacterium CG10_big_fil_rev_8_21_14_0_10_43_8]PIV11796.1 MAG: 3-oxoacyl-ACP reductase [Candidatus Omnitrophica bacterium CG03_land_8_20_14_0_80_43_22]PIW66862.1 MAG: 3-oxoacyl-ACP reductase [Candidatus Omnitrophica bacterium CG12_big_fil_rev_8_21_14_0_65_43_15]PIW80489.1 MAG: 3-oxoacyl-ACP reductase [Candidatus Omnitrophica bacterium